MNEPQRLLVFLLRLDAVILLGALFAVVLPRPWMAGVHAWLGMGSLPDAVIVGYLTRSLASLYALRGVLLFYISFDVVRYAPLITMIAMATIAFALSLLSIDLAVGMPWFWTLIEGPGIAAIWTAILWLQRQGAKQGTE